MGQRIEEKVRERHKDLRRGDKRAELKVKDLYEEAARMPLLMERSAIQSWKTRSRVRALAKMQKALENNGLKKEIRSKDLINEDERDLAREARDGDDEAQPQQRATSSAVRFPANSYLGRILPHSAASHH